MIADLFPWFRKTKSNQVKTTLWEVVHNQEMPSWMKTQGAYSKEQSTS